VVKNDDSVLLNSLKNLSLVLNQTVNMDELYALIDTNAEIASNSCQGDSGGPMFYKNEDDLWYVYGVVSFGHTDKNGFCQVGLTP
jgi:secreted trypsin-like serine protease